MGTNNDYISYRRLSMESKSPSDGSGGGGGFGLHRSRSVRASFRLLGARWKAPVAPVVPQPHTTAEPPAGEVVRINTTNTTATFTKRFDKQLPTRYTSDHFHKAKKKKLKSKGCGSRHTLAKENWLPTAMPENVPPKAAAILEIPVDREQFNRNTSQFLMSGMQFKFLKRSISLNNEVAIVKETDKPRTATIRRGSVWANSTLKLTLPDLVTKITSTPTSKGDAVKATGSKQLRNQLPPQPPPSSTMNMEFLIPHLPPTTTRPGQPPPTSTSSSSRKTASSNGSILQSAINNLNSKHNHQPPPALMTQHSHPSILQNHQHLPHHQQQQHLLHHHHHSHLIQPPPPNSKQKIVAIRDGGSSSSSSASSYPQPPSLVKLSSQSAASASPPKILPLTGASSTRLEAHPESSQSLLSTVPLPPLLPQQQHKMTKKQLKLAQAQLDKLTQINIHLHALFSAVENGHLEKARTILESTDVDVNSLNTDGLSPLDVAVLSNNRSLTKMLLQHGAVEGSQFKTADSLGNHLNALMHDAENRVYELGGAEDNPQIPFSTRASFSSIIGNAYTGPSVTGCAGSESDKQMGLWERRVKGLRRMLLGWDQARPPDPPHSIVLDVTSCNSVALRIQESTDGPIATKCKIQWSSRADFSNVVGERDVNEWNTFQGTMGANCRITELTQGRRYFFRASCGNVKGWGQFQLSVPNSVIPSSWRDMEKKEPRFAGRQRILDELFTAVRLARPDDASEFPMESMAIQRRNPKKKTTIKQLFSAASKFQKNLRRGIYLACILYHEDKVLVTNEDFVPVIEIDETYPSCLHTDYHWLMKVGCTWDDVKLLRTDMEKNATSAVHFRTKLLAAACQMQSALCIQDLGQLFHKPLRDSHGTIVLSCVSNVKSPKCVSVLNSRWIPLNKVQKKITALHEDNNINEILLSSIQEQIIFHQSSTVRLTKGLYLGYLKMQSSVDQIQIVVAAKTPNVLPHCKIRDNPHISAEEWEFLRRNKVSCSYELQSDKTTDVQELFLDALTHAAHRLFKYMDISLEHALNHRLFDLEVIELSADVSFLVVCPPAESSCAVPGHREILLQRGDLISLPVQAFEMIHLRTYHNGIIQKYARLSCILELDTVLANHSLREAFSTTEVQMAKEHLSKLQDLTKSLNTVWKGVRWLMDVIGFARDRCGYLGLNMKEIFNFNPGGNETQRIDSTSDGAVLVSCTIGLDSNGSSGSLHGNKRHLLQPPPRNDNKLVKSSPGRGSWPGPTHSLGANGLLGAEHSKSEQQLSLTIGNISSRYLSATSGFDNSRKNSADSNYSHSGNSYYSAGESVEHIVQRLPPSRSEDTLVVTKKSLVTPLHRKRATTVNATSKTSSPKLTVRHVSTTYKSNKTESAHSLSSDSDGSGAAYPMSTSTPASKAVGKGQGGGGAVSVTVDSYLDREVKTVASRSKRQLFDGDGPASPATQKEMNIFKEPLHIAEDESRHERLKKTESAPFPFKTTTTSPERAGSAKRKTAKDAEFGQSSSSSAMTISTAPGIIQVYAAYETGLASGTSLKLHVTPKTSAREVVDLVVKQLNMAVVLKGKDGPIYAAEKLENFCLVAVIGARERCLRDDFKPLQLQNPWKKGRLYVRQKHDLLAAIEHSNNEVQMI